MTRHIIDLTSLGTTEINHILDDASQLSRMADGLPQFANSVILASCFFQPSTRTRLSTESAFVRLGGNVISSSDQHQFRSEPLADILRCVEGYAHVIAVRHPDHAALVDTAPDVGIPIINCGTGRIAHPTQTIADLLAIRIILGRLEGRRLLLLGDYELRASRSLLSVRARMGFSVDIASPKLDSDQQLRDYVEGHYDVNVRDFSSLPSLLSGYDVVYVKPISTVNYDSSNLEHGSDQLRSVPLLSVDDVRNHMREDAIVLHSLPRFGELDPAIDVLPQARYFDLSRLAVFARMSLFRLVFGII